MSADAGGNERRKVQRRRCLFSGNIAYNGAQSTLSGRVRDMSSEGACLVVGHNLDLPLCFDLLLSNGMARVPARLIWRSEDRIGVAFAIPDQGTRDALPLISRPVVH